ncbi:MAG TPA: biotin-dependent carboxyltransferase family protein [Burkholderiales bacterium]|nr:biotin-dependent carboxyltransferase family protein [Burkholderiales bacterium]
MTRLRVIKAGICSTVQDFGRTGYRVYGVPQSGALDRVSLELANRLVGNSAFVAAIEMMYSGVALRAEGGSVRVALAGAHARIERDGETTPLGAFHSATLAAGDTLRVATIAKAATAYLAIEGGLDVPRVLDSASTYLRGALGGYQGRPLRAGDVLTAKLERPADRAERRYASAPMLDTPSALRIMRGPQSARFDDASRQRLLAAAYTVSTSSDRSGLRLEGEALSHVGGFDLVSEGVAPGSIQVPGSGLPVILIGDHPTVGGYPKIATIVSADLAAAGRLRIGSRVSFREVDEEEARSARSELRREIEAAVASVQDVRT